MAHEGLERMFPSGEGRKGVAWIVSIALSAAFCGRAAGPEPAAPAPTDPAAVTPWLVDATVDSGIDFRHVAGAGGGLHLPEIMGGGVGLFDYDGDGDLDVYFTSQNRTFDPAGSGEPPRNRLYRQDAPGRFTDATDAAGLGDRGFGMGLAVGDVDNDGDLDVYLTNYGEDRLYRNRGDGTFEDVSATALRADTSGWSCSAAFLDYDRDGWLDLFVTRYVAYDPAKPCQDEAGRSEYCGPTAFPPVSDRLLHNDGGGVFRDVSDAAGIGGARAAGLGVVVADFDDDGWVDVYVANDAYANHLWINRHDGTFRDDAVLLGAAYNLHGTPQAGMGVVADDFDNDGRTDLFVTNLSQETNALYRSLGPDGFDDVTGSAGLGTSSMSWTGFGAAAFDLELDGDLDLAVANGRVTRADAELPGAAVAPFWRPYAEPNLLYRNDDGSFAPLGDEVAAFTRTVEVSRGLAAGDLDADGDLDLVLSNLDGPARLYRNDAPRAGHFLLVRAVDPRYRRDAIGARVTIRLGDAVLTRWVTRAAGYLSATDSAAHFGLGQAQRVDALEVRWADGSTERFGPFEVDTAVRVERGGGTAAP